jgi:hypothetical protein
VIIAVIRIVKRLILLFMEVIVAEEFNGEALRHAAMGPVG